MDASFRCNSLKCRRQLSDQAVVTTCSHIFCLKCSNAIGLSQTNSSDRACPACQTRLSNPDDVVVSTLNPSEDYKTSVLSGLTPSIIMECAGRGLAFYSYQATQEIVYQEFLGKGLTEKHAALSGQMDQVIHDANAEILSLRSKLATVQTDMDSLKNKHQELTVSYGDKVRSCVRAQKMYDELKKQMLQLDVQNAAADAVTRTLASSQNHQPNHAKSGIRSSHPNFGSRVPGARERHPTSNSNSTGSGGRNENTHFQRGHQQPLYGSRATADTPADHRMQLPLAQPSTPRDESYYRGSHPQHTVGPRSQFAHRQPLQAVNPNVPTNGTRHRMEGASYGRKPYQPNVESQPYFY